MRTPRAVNNLIDDLFERKYRKVGQEKNALGFFSRWVFCFNIVTPGKGSKNREFYALSGRITCMYSELELFLHDVLVKKHQNNTLSIYLPIRLNPERGHQMGSGNPGTKYWWLVCCC